MKKITFILAMGFVFTFCSPQRTGQTGTGSGTTGTSTGTGGTGTTGSGTQSDTTRPH
ncbi:hypothetical protein [Segetibacter sp.]|uniref:hypothetical protein n=1 Tax=Segetibacter sp. TaxID=2231182 RepID=UPI00260A8CB8|nr:hypothetical protein [Segetibacter sp.]